MSPELKQTIDVIFEIVMFLCWGALIIAVWYLKWKTNKQDDEIKKKSYEAFLSKTNFKSSEQIIRLQNILLKSKQKKIYELTNQLHQYEFVMAVSDDISAELVKENKDLLDKVELLKAKLNHKKRPTK